MHPVVLSALSVCLAVGLALLWTVFFGKENRTVTRLDNAARTVSSGTPTRTLSSPGDPTESSGIERESRGGAVGADASAEAPSETAPYVESSRLELEDPTYAEAERRGEPESARPSDRSASPKQPDAPKGDLTISGRVLTRAGTPVSGIAMIASSSYVLDAETGKLVRTDGHRRNATSAYDGSYEFRELADGEYHIRTTATERYAQTSISVRAGVDFADIVLLALRELNVRGVVSSSMGEPLDGAKVQPLTRQGTPVVTDPDGRYAIAVKVPETARSLIVRASKHGYKDKKLPLKIVQSDAAHDVELNVALDPDTTTASAEVAGTVRSNTGAPIAGQRVQLASGKVRRSYRATTDDGGEFLMQGVETSDDYVLSINAAETYEDYFQRNLRVTEDGLSLRIVLKSKDVGTLSGQMVDLYGNPISNFSLLLQTKKASYYNRRVVGDALGAFSVENAPAGALRLKTRSNPYHHIDGFRLAAGTEQHVVLVLDTGYAEIRGRVLDDRGYPVAVPSIHLTWSYTRNGVRSASRRTTAADARGEFRFTQLGPGPHTVSINLSGFKPVRFQHDAAAQGPDVVVRLEKRKKQKSGT